MRSVLLTMSVVFIVLGITTSPVLGDRTPIGTSYMLHENWGGIWSDAEKTRTSTEDDNLCWAGAAANVLEWTGWGQVDGMTTTDEMFDYFQDHWTDRGGQMTYGWRWWFSGVNPSRGWSGWSQVDVAGGGFHPSENYYSLYHYTSSNSNAMSAIDTYLRSGYGTTIGIYGPGGHAITVWGFTHDDNDASEYNGLYITDSDDYKYHPNAPDRLRYYEVEYTGGKWYLQNYGGSSSWYIGGVHALEAAPRDDVNGDIDGNSEVNADDIDLLAEAIRKGSFARTFDLNIDGQVNDGDMDKLVHDILGTDYGDFNLDGMVDIGDYGTWATFFLSSGKIAGGSGWEGGDANGDGMVNLSDYARWAETINNGGISGSEGDAAPEPGTIALLCTGGMFLIRRKSRKH